MKFFIPSCFLLFNTVITYSQLNDSLFLLNSKKFSIHVENYLVHKNSLKYDSLCIKSIAFIKFQIDQEGIIDSIFCNSSTPKILSNLFIEAIKSGYKLLIPLNNKKKSGKLYFLPIVYLLNRNCDPQDNTFESVSSMMNFYPQKKNVPRFPLSNNRSYDNCILLSPLLFMSRIH
ncbi:MAG: hypothetical protein WKF85_15715 [Chitinophagaceae bacterium]